MQTNSWKKIKDNQKIIKNILIRSRILAAVREFFDKEGLPKTAGIAVGVDRLVMLFTDSADIHEVSPFSK